MMADTKEPDKQFAWERVKRVAVYKSPWRARYPSIAKAVDDSLLVLFTRQSPEQEQAGLGDFVLVRSADGGCTWSEEQVVFSGQAGEPRAIGTMTALKNGRIIVPFAELNNSQDTSTVRLLISDDGGKSWKLNAPKVTSPLAWWVPCGKVLEAAGLSSALVMPVYGTVSQTALKATIHNCGLLRSSDGGETWGDLSWIAQGSQPIIGANPNTKFSFEGPALQKLADGRLLAMVTARRLNKAGDGPTILNEGPGAPQVLCRLWSSDEGRTWSEPEQLTPGAWPSLAGVGQHTLCANTLWAAWGEMRLIASDDGFRTFFQEVPMLTRGWTRGMTNRPQETPPPPTVPYLADEWPFEHYGFPSVLTLDEDNLIVVFGRTQSGTPGYGYDPAESENIPVEKEQIQAIFYHRKEIPGELLAPPAAETPTPRGRWVLAERIIVEDVGAMAQAPGGDLIGKVRGKLSRSSDGGRTWKEIDGTALPGDVNALGMLRNGRWLAAMVKENNPPMTDARNEVERLHPTINMGMRDGYSVFKQTGERYDWSVVVCYSDDQGKTWQCGKSFKGPFQWAIPTVSHFIESHDGTVALPIFGCVTDEEVDSYSASNGVIRSHDGGETWGDFSFVFRANPKGPDDFQPEPRYSEMDIVQLPNGHWVAYSRNEYLTMGPKGAGVTEVAISDDSGRTWGRTGGSLVGVSQQNGVLLPDGGIALTYRSHSWQAPGVAISYDEGRSFNYALAGPYETVNAFAHGKDEFLVFTGKSHRSDMSVAVYRFLPSKPPDTIPLERLVFVSL